MSFSSKNNQTNKNIQVTYMTPKIFGHFVHTILQFYFYIPKNKNKNAVECSFFFLFFPAQLYLWNTAHLTCSWPLAVKSIWFFCIIHPVFSCVNLSPITALDVGLNGGSAPLGMTLWSQTWVKTQHLTLILHLLIVFFNEDWMEMFKKVKVGARKQTKTLSRFWAKS